MGRVKYLHARDIAYDDDGNPTIWPRGGFTIAYLPQYEEEVILLQWTLVHPRDNYNKKIGRDLTTKRFTEEGPGDVIPLVHPIRATLQQWAADQLGIGLFVLGKTTCYEPAGAPE